MVPTILAARTGPMVPPDLVGTKRPRDTTDSNISSITANTKRVRTARTGSGWKLSPEPFTPADLAATGTSTVDVFRKFVNGALDEKAAGNSSRYEELRQKFQSHPVVDNDSAPSSGELQKTLLALTNTVSRLNNSCYSLINDIVNAQWIGRDRLFVEVYVRFLGNLVSAHANYMGMVTRMLVGYLTFVPASIGKLPGYKIVERNTIYDRVHDALERILELVPTAGFSIVFPALCKELPHQSESKLNHTWYLKNVLRVIEYLPALRNKILAIVTDRIIKLDTAMQAGLDKLSDEESEKLEQELSVAAVTAAGEGERDSVDIDTNPEDEEKDEPESDDVVTTIKKTADKLDSMLDILFEFYSSCLDIKSSEDTPAPDPDDTFKMLIRFFNTTIFPTYRSRYTQFLLFWAVQKSSHFTNLFCADLIQKIQDAQRPQKQRQKAANYIASFVARAKFLPSSYIRQIIRLLCRYLNKYVNDFREGSGSDIEPHGGFYSTCEAVMYIFCYRWRELKEREEEDEFGLVKERWTKGLEVMDTVVKSKLNPLKICSSVVVDMFAKVAQHLQFMHCFSIIEQNKRGGLIREGQMMEIYFPFDPYDLKNSRRWIEECYVEWQAIPGLEEEGESSQEDEGSEVGDVEDVSDSEEEE